MAAKIGATRPKHVYGAEREPRWHASLAVVATVLLSLSLPESLTLGPFWLVPGLTILLLIPLTFAVPHRYMDEPHWQRVVTIILIAMINLANIVSLVQLIYLLLHGTKAEGGALIIESIKIWLTNVLIFALWYWELDRGGPGERLRSPDQQQDPDFLFPQLQMKDVDGAPLNWRPMFLDYVYLAFTNATAFSPTDTLPLTPWAKMLMLVQSLASLLTVAIVAARAVNILS
jgi:uncharacterized membrane protein